MEVLQFARGPALNIALVVFLVGTLWRLVGVLMLEWQRVRSTPREGAPAPVMAALSTVFSKMWPYKPFVKPALFAFVNGYVFHVGLAVTVLLFAPHVLFIKSLTGLSWPTLPSNVVLAVSVITAASLLAALAHRVTSPVLRLISRVDDYISWLMTFLPMLTGLLATAHIGPPYEKMLAVHILSICAFLIWFPFGKLMHALLFVVSRGATGVRFKHRGAEA